MSNIQPLILHTFLDECVFVKRPHSGNFYVSAVDTSLDINAASLSKCRVTQGRVWPLLLDKSTMVARQRGSWHNWSNHGRCVCVCVCACTRAHTYFTGTGCGGRFRQESFLNDQWPTFVWELFHPIHGSSPSISLKKDAPQGDGQLRSDLSQVGGTRPWQRGTELMLLWNTKTLKEQ